MLRSGPLPPPPLTTCGIGYAEFLALEWLDALNAEEATFDSYFCLLALALYSPSCSGIGGPPGERGEGTLHHCSHHQEL